MKVSSKGFYNFYEIFKNEISKVIYMNSYFVSILDIKENYNKIEEMHNLLNVCKLISKEFSKFKKVKIKKIFVQINKKKLKRSCN